MDTGLYYVSDTQNNRKGTSMSINSFVSPDGRIGYRIRVNIGKDQDGRYIQKCRTCYGTAIQAQAVEHQMKMAAERAKNAQTEAEIYQLYAAASVGARKIPVRNAFDKAMEKPHCRTSSEQRIEFHRNYWSDFVLYLKEKHPLIKYMQDVTCVIAEDYIGFIRKNGAYRKWRKTQSRTGLSNDTLNEMHRTCQQVFELLKHETAMMINPFAEIGKLAAKHAEREAYTDEQLKEIFLKADHFLQPLFFVGLFTGLSEGDVCTLRKDEIHLDRHHIYRMRNKTKKSSERVSAIPMLPVLEDFLKRLIENGDDTSEYILPEQAAVYLHCRSDMSRRIKHLLEIECGFETSRKIEGRKRMQSVLDFHSLRHTFCSLAGVAGVPQNVVQSIVGHMTPRMTALYSRHVEEKERLHWIRLFGQRLNDLPGIAASVELPQIGMEPERAELLNAIGEIDIETARKMLEMIKK